MSRVKISDVARQAGVSVGTVSNALNHPDKVRPETLDLINATIARMGYVPNQGARQLAGGKSTTFGLVLPRLDHAFSLQIADGAHAAARERGYDILIASAGNEDILENHYMRYFLGAQMAGMLVQPMASGEWEPPCIGASIPVVYLDVHCEQPGFYVAADNEGQGRLMIDHAVSRGARRIAVVGEATFGQLALRVRGTCAAAAEKGVQLEIVDRGEWNSFDDGIALGRAFGQQAGAERPDFIVGLTDVLAAGIIAGLADAGVRVPGDIMVAGCDGNPLAWGGDVPLTTIASPGEEIGREGVRLLLQVLEGTAKDSVRRVLVESKLCPRASTAKA